MNKYSRNLASNIQIICKSRKIRIGDVEKAAGLSTGYLARCRNGSFNRGISLDTAAEIARILGVSLNSLIDENLALIFKLHELEQRKVDAKNEQVELEEEIKAIKARLHTA